MFNIIIYCLGCTKVTFQGNLYFVKTDNVIYKISIIKKYYYKSYLCILQYSTALKNNA